jgi:hypothetical protein
MKIIRKPMSLLLAGIIAAASLFCGAVTASADELKELVSVPVTDLDSKAESVYSFTNNLYAMSSEDRTYLCFYYMTEDDIKEFGRTGKISAKKIETDSKLDGAVFYEFRPFSEQCYSRAVVSINNEEWYAILHYDKEANKIDVTYMSTNTLGCTEDGYIIEVLPRMGKSDKQFIFRDNNGKRIKKLTVKTGITNPKALICHFSESTNCACLTYFDPEDTTKGKTLIFDKTGKKTDITDKIGFVPTLVYTLGNAYSYTGTNGYAEVVYNPANQKWFRLKKASTFRSGSTGDVYKLIGIFNDDGGRGIGMYYTGSDEPYSDENTYAYALVDLENDRILSKAYTEITTSDGNTYLAFTSRNNVVFLDSNGQQIKGFVYADAFHEGDDAVTCAVTDNKVRLIDIGMNTVSETLDAERCFNVENGLFVLLSDSKPSFFTIKQ